MPKIQVLSDIHNEVTSYDYIESDADILVLAGDIGYGKLGVEKFCKLTSKPIIFVAGNHEYYRQDYDDVQKDFKTLMQIYPHLHWLENNSVEVLGIRFIGSTLWTNFELTGNPELAMAYAARGIADFSRINYKGQWFQPEDARCLNKQTIDYLSKTLAIPFNGKTVVVSHFVPSAKSIHPKYEGSNINPYFTSNFDDLVALADIWIHGHTHDSFEYKLGKCTVVCNPRGYVNKYIPFENVKFSPECFVNISGNQVKVDKTIPEFPLLPKLKVYEDENGRPYYVKSSELPEFWQEQLEAFMYGQTCPAPDNGQGGYEYDAVYPWDYARWEGMQAPEAKAYKEWGY